MRNGTHVEVVVHLDATAAPEAIYVYWDIEYMQQVCGALDDLPHGQPIQGTSQHTIELPLMLNPRIDLQDANEQDAHLCDRSKSHFPIVRMHDAIKSGQ